MNEERPDFSKIVSGKEFNRWYWLKAEMVEICKVLSLPYAGGKFELRDRIMYALDNGGKLLKVPKAKRVTSHFNWAKEKLMLDTVITDNVTFGPNFRNFMKYHIGKKFSCHSDFMDWVKNNTGKTLKDAIFKWEELEVRKKNPSFKREIATHNMMSQYIRDFFKDNPDLSFQEAHRCWKMKKGMPMKNGRVQYDKNDLAHLKK